MNIKPTPIENVPPQPVPPIAQPPVGGKQTLHEFFVEEFRPERCQQIREALRDASATRPEVIEQAKQLLADPNFPNRAQLTQLAKMIVGTAAPMPPMVEPPTDQNPPAPIIEPPVTDPPQATPIATTGNQVA